MGKELTWPPSTRPERQAAATATPTVEASDSLWQARLPGQIKMNTRSTNVGRKVHYKLVN